MLAAGASRDTHLAALKAESGPLGQTATAESPDNPPAVVLVPRFKVLLPTSKARPHRGLFDENQ